MMFVHFHLQTTGQFLIIFDMDNWQLFIRRENTLCVPRVHGEFEELSLISLLLVWRRLAIQWMKRRDNEIIIWQSTLNQLSLEGRQYLQATRTRSDARKHIGVVHLEDSFASGGFPCSLTYITLASGMAAVRVQKRAESILFLSEGNTAERL